ncbi:carboxymuconolactone decarboxylase family protein [Hydrocarboniphaga sp.]|uniref:carboxymuconolactone decarboxylase family protein n=1 Tax=Hydrocarboniphaga sp. TaxID=2033016 RepID=UPI0026247336|nr:carboxymuconolactone decarboxylase family protein [Hydrocarboniphaga sp.]
MDALAAFPTSLNFVMKGWSSGDRAVRGMNVLGTFAHYPALAKAFMTFNAHVAGASSLLYRDREIVILRLSWVMHSEYELVQHMILGKRAGLSDEEIGRLQQGPDAPGWSAEDADLVRAVDQLHELSRITPATWERLAQRYNQSQMLDLIFLVGCYAALALAINSLETPIESGAPPLGEATRQRLLASIATPLS